MAKETTAPSNSDSSYQSLYRRYRSQRFDEIVGQSHVTNALKNAIAENRLGHAYLFSGPRGTGKTSTARILAKALNCDNLTDGEPCNTCDSCVAITEGRSFDIHELDAASNNKVDDVRDLISKVHLGSPGRNKVYILDEVHMLSSGAENALLKTLEEPPEHVIFVLATTEPHKVVSTIRSRTQRFKFGLIGAQDLTEHVRYVAKDAGLDVDEDMIEYAITQGKGSARDTLTALDTVVAAGAVPTGIEEVDSVLRAVATKDPKSALVSVQQCLEHGLEPRTIGESLLASLRNCFLGAMGVELTHVTDLEKVQIEQINGQTTPADLTEALETLGQALVDMRQAADPRVSLEVALLKLTRTQQPNEPVAGKSRVETTNETVEQPVSKPAPKSESKPKPEQPKPQPVKAAEPKLAAEATKAKPEPEKQQPESASEPAPVASQPVADGNSNLQSFYLSALEEVSQKVRVRFKPCTYIGSTDTSIQLTSPNEVTESRCVEVKGELEQSLSRLSGRDIAIEFSEPGVQPAGKAQSSQPATPAPAKATPQPEAEIDLRELVDADDTSGTSFDRVKQVFPGAKVVTRD